MDLFHYIPDQYVSEVSSIMNNDKWDNNTKIEFLKEIVDSPLILQMCEDYLKTKNAAPASSPASFILLLPPDQQTLAQIWLQKENIKALDKLIQKHKGEKNLKDAYFQWKRYYKQKKVEEEVTRPKVKDTHIKLTNHSEIAERLPKETNIVFLGGTGVGKTTFINSFVNYMLYDSLQEAQKHKPIVLIPSVFLETDEQLNEHKISVKATVLTDAGSEANEIAVTGESATQNPHAYVISFKSGKKEKLIRIIDTPGIGDTRGLDVEKMNMDKILSFLSQYEEIHAFCIALKSNESRRTLGFKYCLNQLLIQLHNSAAKNIMFCLTNGGATQYKPGDSMPVLRVHVKEIRDKQKVIVRLDQNTIHTFENDSFRYLCAMHSNTPITYTESQKKMFAISWDESSASTGRMLSAIAALQPHQLYRTVSIHNTRTAISALGPPLAEVYRIQSLNEKIMGEKKAEVEKCLREGLNLQGKLCLDEFNIALKETPYPITVCTHPKCVRYETLFDGNGRYLRTVNKTECHTHCYLTDVEKETTNNPKLKFCQAMGNTRKGGEQCVVCKCSWSMHKHVYQRYEEVRHRTLMPEVEQVLAKNEQIRQKEHLILAKIEKRMKELEEEKKRIKNYCAEFACFLKANALLHFNDTFGEYIDQLIIEERGKVSAGALDDILQDLIVAREEYNRQVEHFTTNETVHPKTLEQINEMIKELKDMKVNGNFLREVQKVKLRYNKKATLMNRTSSVRLDNIRKFLSFSSLSLNK